METSTCRTDDEAKFGELPNTDKLMLMVATAARSSEANLRAILGELGIKPKIEYYVAAASIGNIMDDNSTKGHFVVTEVRKIRFERVVEQLSPGAEVFANTVKAELLRIITAAEAEAYLGGKVDLAVIEQQVRARRAREQEAQAAAALEATKELARKFDCHPDEIQQLRVGPEMLTGGSTSVASAAPATFEDDMN